VLVGLSGGAPGRRREGRLAARKLGRTNDAATPWAALGIAGTPSLAGGTSFVTEPLSLLPLAGGTTGAEAVAIAERFLGVRYVWGGASPITGFDCSGLTQYVYHQLGISLTHFTGTQIHEGTPVPEPLLEPGDLVFFEPQSFGPGHVGMYVGGGEFIHAPHTGDVVKISRLSGHYQQIYVGAVRPY
jgi:cell wall-associated NlpC family hydrolase